MKIKRMLIGALLAGILALAPSAYAVSLSVSSDAGGFTENINAGVGDSVYGSTLIGSDSLSNSIEGSGDFREDHWVSNPEGDNAGVGVDIRNARYYNYGWNVGGSINPDKVWAGEDVNVIDASYISAYAKSFNARGSTAEVSTVLSDPGNRASLSRYSNLATASANDASASQSAEMAYALDGSIQTEAEAWNSWNELTISSEDLAGERSEASTTVQSGSIVGVQSGSIGYTDSAKASLISHRRLDVSQSIVTAKGNQIDTESRSVFGKANAEVSTETFGALTNYKGTATKDTGIAPPYAMDVYYGDSVQAEQSAHISGQFTSTAVAGSASKTRTSNYGDEYDLNMQAYNGYAFGTLGYYVDVSNPIANRIQGAVDASESGDAINVAEGTYNENVKIDKSLTVSGSGAGRTIVDGQQSGSVFTIGENNPNAYVSLSGLTIQGGSDSGIKNFASMRLKDSTISGNTANFGGGISNYGRGTVEVYGGSIMGNTAIFGGGGIFSRDGKVNLVGGSIISDNRGHGSAGGIYIAQGTLNLYKSSICNNTAGNGYNGTVDLNGNNLNGDKALIPIRGGGIYIVNGTVNLLAGGNITENYAPQGGGIYSEKGILNLRGGNIINNTASSYGGGIYSSGIVNLIAGSISYNKIIWGGGNGGGIFDYGTITGNEDLVKYNDPDDIYRPKFIPTDLLELD